ncbi:class I SAM-dependent methyltransferase [Streptomyces sp. NPDC005149]
MTSYTPDELFASTAPFNRYRPGYAPDLYEQIRDLLGLDGTQRVLDLGTGPGVLALPLSRMAREVVSVDPEPGMLVEARKVALEQGVANIRWTLGDSTNLMRLGIEAVTLAVMGAAFHWTDRDQVLRDLHRLVVPEGAAEPPALWSYLSGTASSPPCAPSTSGPSGGPARARTAIPGIATRRSWRAHRSTMCRRTDGIGR